MCVDLRMETALRSKVVLDSEELKFGLVLDSKVMLRALDSEVDSEF